MPLNTLLNLTSDRLHTLPLVVLYLTDGCNSRCVMCDIWRNPRRNMPMTLIEGLLAHASRLGVRHVLLSGGEAMQHPDWPQIASQFRAAGVRVMLLTNGLLVRKQAEQIITHVDELIISLDAADAPTYQAIRGVDAFDLILDGIRAVKAGGIAVTTRTTVQAGNFRQLPRLIEVALSAGVDRVSFLAVDVGNEVAFGERFTVDSGLPIVNQPRLALNRAEVAELDALIHQLERDYAPAFAARRIAESPDKLRRILVQYFGALAGCDTFTSPPCNAPRFSVVIEVDGRVRPCYFLPTGGQLRPDASNLGDVLNGGELKTLRRAYRTGQRAECARCVCPLYKSVQDLARF